MQETPDSPPSSAWSVSRFLQEGRASEWTMATVESRDLRDKRVILRAITRNERGEEREREGPSDLRCTFRSFLGDSFILRSPANRPSYRALQLNLSGTRFTDEAMRNSRNLVPKISSARSWPEREAVDVEVGSHKSSTTLRWCFYLVLPPPPVEIGSLSLSSPRRPLRTASSWDGAAILVNQR